jgi:aryl carrier-like protein
VLDALPLSANGKVDRKAAAALVDGQVPAEPADGPPETEVEVGLAALWSEVLDVPGIGRHSSFFALGGDSLLATRLIERIRREFGLDLTLRQLFTQPTLAEVAAAIQAERDGVRGGAVEEGVV